MNGAEHDPVPSPNSVTEWAELRARVAHLEMQVAELNSRLVPRPHSADAPQPTPPAPAPPVVFATATTPRSADLETRLGSQVLSKIAVLLLLVGAAWFLKWAFDNRWIGPAGRVLIGLAAGSALILWSERFRRNGTPAFSYALKAIGSGVLYLSLWASFHLFSLVPAPIALTGMVLVTAWNAWMALQQDSRLLAGYALLGAYLTPALLSSGGNHEVFLFLYLASVAAALLVLLRARPWSLLLLGPLALTGIYYTVWAMRWMDAASYPTTLALTLLLWALFAAVPLVAQERDSARINVLHPLAVALFGAGAVHALLISANHHDSEPWAAVLAAAVYLALSRLRHETAASAIHLSLALAFLTVAIPLKATGHGITLGWLAEAAAVLWMATLPRLDTRARGAMLWLGLIASLLGTTGALLHPAIDAAQGSAFANRDFFTELSALALLAWLLWLSPRLELPLRWAPPSRNVQILAFLTFNLVLALTIHGELARLFSVASEDSVHQAALRGFAFSGWLAIQGAVMLAAGFWRRRAEARWMGLALLAITLLKTVFYDMRLLSTGFRVFSYMTLGALLLAISYAYQKGMLHVSSVLAQEAEEPR